MTAQRDAEEVLASSLAGPRSLWFNTARLAKTPMQGWYPWPVEGVTAAETAVLRVLNQLTTTAKTAVLKVQGVVTSFKTGVLRVAGATTTTNKSALLMVNSTDGTLGTGFRSWFLYPFVKSTTEAGLRRAIKGNAEAHVHRILAREARGGTDIRFRRGGRRRALTVQFTHLTATMKTDIETFFNTVGEQAFRYVDHQERTWKAWRLPGEMRFVEGAPDELYGLSIGMRVEDVL